ncbi:RdgB/HAM1 family non-canonical purine NTP pyrophosphatase [Thorsellia anophelis]|uniref:dITP/XTP pyrophosphatase n=1 Tax=Thorsellia anophelis DSM 18579 TaxID=1123402 RepID=A0A1H9YD74_9GAMM|nr:RdgB/HAM1 family non-canonical purine NTP pyrophosphatase [Thorsellia anophelis]SES66814.1 XTP/dITP diphosphohydrolase [Thorsellia anophelis DSM 18579]
MQKLVLATANPGKVNEIQHLLGQFGWDVIAQTDLNVTSVEETGLTFIENAILKARHASLITGLPALADDSGLSVIGLQGEPGIYSARYAGIDATDQENNTKLIETLKQNPTINREATFHCALVFLTHATDPAPIVCYGIWHGQIIDEPRGNQGFGYDPYFYIPDLDKTAAQLTREEKHQYSHRGQALSALFQHFNSDTSYTHSK